MYADRYRYMDNVDNPIVTESSVVETIPVPKIEPVVVPPVVTETPPIEEAAHLTTGSGRKAISSLDKAYGRR